MLGRLAHDVVPPLAIAVALLAIGRLVLQRRHTARQARGGASKLGSPATSVPPRSGWPFCEQVQDEDRKRADRAKQLLASRLPTATG